MVEYVQPASVVEYVAPVPAVTYEDEAEVEYLAPAPTVAYLAPATTMTAPTVAHAAPAVSLCSAGSRGRVFWSCASRDLRSAGFNVHRENRRDSGTPDGVCGDSGTGG